MSLKTRYGNLGNVYDQAPSQTRILQLESPLLLTTGAQGAARPFRRASSRPSTAPSSSAPAPGALREALARIRAEAEDAVREGYEQIVLSDEAGSDERAPIPMILAAGAVHSHLVREGLRSFSSITVRSGECLDVHYVAVLIGVGATAVNPYLAEAAIADRHARGLFPGLTLEECLARYKEAVDQGLLKIMSKMGISIVSSYRGGYNFEAVGLSRSLCAEYFPGLITRISGIGLAGIQNKVLALHRRAFDDDNPPLAIGGLYRYRRGGERHALEGPAIHQLQYAVASDSYAAYKKYAEMLYRQEPIAIRDLLDFDRRQTPVPIDEVEIDHRDPQALRHARHVARRALARGARDADHRDEPDRRQVGQRRGRRGQGALPAAAQRRQRQLADQAGRLRPLRRHRGVPERLPRARDQDRPGRQARRGRAAAGLQGHGRDRPAAARDPRRHADLAAAAPRHLLDRGSGPADLRPEADQPGRQGLRQAGLGEPGSARSRPASPRPRPT